MSIKIINVPINRLDDRVYTHHLIPHVVKELNKDKGPVIVITDKELFAHGLIIASHNVRWKSTHYNELNKFVLNILNGNLTETLYLFDNLGILNKLLPYTTTEAFFFQTSQLVMRNALQVVKRLYGNNATLSDLKCVLNNTGNNGKKMVNDFQRLPTQNWAEACVQEEIALWFLNDYYAGICGTYRSPKTFDYASSVRMNLMNFIDEWATISEIDSSGSRYREEIIPTTDLITVNLSTLKSNKSNAAKYLVHKLSQSIPNSTVYVDISNSENIEWESVLLNNRNVSTIIQTIPLSKKSDLNHRGSIKQIRSFKGTMKVTSSEIEKQIALYYENLNTAKQSNIDDDDTEFITIGLSNEISTIEALECNLFEDEREFMELGQLETISKTSLKSEEDSEEEKSQLSESNIKSDDLSMFESEIFIGEISFFDDSEDL